MRLRALGRSEAGQTTALVCAMLFTLVLFVALVVNVGQLVNRRVALQLVADAGAWSGATVQAVQLNHYAFWSRQMQNAYKTASAVSLGFRFGECVSSNAAVAAYYYAASGMVRAGLKFAGKAYSEAERHSKFNIDDLFPGEYGNFDFSTIAGPDDGAVGALARGNIIPIPLSRGDRLYTGDHAWSRETIGQWGIELTRRLTSWMPLSRSTMGSGSESWTCYTFPTTVSRVTLAGPAGFKLQRLGPMPYLFVWRVREKTPTRALFFDSFFGPNALPAMTAVAVAKAVGGNVQEGKSRYRAKMVPVSRYSLTSGLIRDSQARPNRILPNPLRRITY